MALVRVGPVRIAISALAPFRPPGWGSVGCRTFVELNLSGALDARHHLGDLGTISGVLCQQSGTNQGSKRDDEVPSPWARIPLMNPPQVEAPRTRDRLRALVSLIASLALVFAGATQSPPPIRAIDTLTILHYPRIGGGGDDLAIDTTLIGRDSEGGAYSNLNQSWSPTATSVIFRWYRCTTSGVETSSLPAGCVSITGAQGYVFHVTETDVGSYFRFAVTGYYGTASSRIWSATVGPVVPNANIVPNFTYAGPLSGDTVVENSLEVGEADFDSYPSSTRTVAWWRCTGEGGAVVEVTDCTLARIADRVPSTGPWRYGAGNYYLTTSDIGYFMRAQLLITNTLGSDSIFTPTSEVVRAQDAILPYFITDPEINSEPLVGTGLNVSWGGYSQGSPLPFTNARSWFACTSEGDSVATLPDGCSLLRNGTYYTPGLSVVGKYLRVSTTLTNQTGSVTHYSATSAAVREPASTVPTIETWPSIAATPKEGSSIGAYWGDVESWGYPQLIEIEQYEWYSCLTGGGEVGSLPANCTRVSSSSGNYIPKVSDVGRYLRAANTYTNDTGSVSAFSATSAAVLPHDRYVPQTVTTPAVTGLAMVTQRLVGNAGAWNAYPTAISYTYRWYRCTDAGVAATSLPSGCTGLAAYTLGYTNVSADLNKYMRLAVTATNGVGSTTIWTQATARVVASALVAPVANNAPCVALDFGGDPYVGAIVSESGCSVTFSGNPPVVGTTSAWYRCNASDTGRTSGSSVSGCVVVQRNLIRPTRASFGTVFNGEVSPAATGNNSNSYQFGPADEGKHLRLAITATNTRGRLTAWSATVGPILAASEVTGKLPISIFPPSLLDEPIVGEQYWQDGGAWVEYGDSDYPPISSYEVRWYRCTSTGEFSDTLPSGCSSAPGTSSADSEQYGGYSGRGSTYLPVASDVGYHLRAAVTAYNAVGQSTLYSATSEAVTAPPNEPPTILNPVTIWYSQASAVAGAGQDATWSAYPAIDNVTYQWYRCSGEAGVAIDARPANCSQIVGATSTYYENTSADAGFRLRIRAHGENIAGEANSFSATSAVLADPAPRNMGGPAAPRLSGGTAVGFPMTAAPGTWDAPAELELQFTYAWYSCTGSGAGTPGSTPSGCSVIKNQAASTFSPTTTHRGKFIRVGVTASNGRGTGVRFSASLGAVGNGPTNSTAPTVTGTARVNSMLTAANGTWTGSPTYTYTWWRCTVSGTDTPATPPDTCARISGATAYRYTLTASERTWYIRVAVTATASGVSVTRFSRTTAVIQ